jgi:hypothetical protein
MEIHKRDVFEIRIGADSDGYRYASFLEDGSESRFALE